MSIFEFAMEMELNGKTYYEEHANKVAHPALKKILLELAGDEQKHYLIFKAMAAGEEAKYEEGEATKILSEVKNIFQELKSSNEELSFTEEARNVWVHAREIEKKAEKFYRDKANEVDDENHKNILIRIADEEQKHWITMDNVLSFLDKPQQWLEDAEWNSLDES